MSTARDYLAAVQQRADRKVLWPAMSPEKANDLVAALNDRRRLVAALTAALDLHVKCASYGLDLCAACRTIWPCDTVAVITDALTPKENDS